MPKRLLQDMVPAKRTGKENKKIEVKKRPENADIEVKYSKTKSRFMLWSVALISVIFFLFALSFLFLKADIKVNPRIKNVVLNESLSAVKDSNANGLSFRLMVISDEESMAIKSSGEKEVSEKATGTVVIYNAFSPSSQTLSVDTRLEGSNGKIYKTKTKTVVPGMKKDGAPGSVEVEIYGAEAGLEYNSAPLDFKIFGFKGTPKYSKFYARSKGDITGGFVGQIPAVLDSDKTDAINSLKTALQAKLLQKSTDYPSEFVLLKDAVFFDINDADASLTAENGNSTITEKGTLYGFLLDEKKLTNKIAEDNIDKYDGSEVYISNIKDFTFSLADKENISFDNVKNINFTLSGSAQIVWKLDVNKFINDLLGKSKKDFNKVLAEYPNIESATLTLSPIWKMSIPNQAKNIKVTVNYPQ